MVTKQKSIDSFNDFFPKTILQMTESLINGSQRSSFSFLFSALMFETVNSRRGSINHLISFKLTVEIEHS